MTIERRFSNTQLRVLPPTHISSSPGTLVGYAALYSSGAVQHLSEDLGGFKERVAPGCFDKSLRAGHDVHAPFNHSPDMPLGRTNNGTLRLRSGAIGLHMEVELPNTSFARDLFESVKRGDVTEQSFAFSVEPPDGDAWDEIDDPDDRSKRIAIRTLRCVRLIDCSPVVYPAYPGTSVSSVDAMARSHGFDSLFPDGVPAELRSRIPSLRSAPQLQERRRNLANLVLGL